MLKTIVDWEPEEAGRHSIVWDGMDSSSVMNLLGNPDVFVNIAAYSLPENSIILEGGEKPVPVERASSKKRPKKEVSVKKHRHALHEKSKCYEPNFKFEVLDTTEDTVPIRVTLDERDKLDLINSRFEIIFFIDNVFLFEEEEGASPFTYKLDTNGLNEGEHILTVNVQGYEDHIAANSKKIFIRRSE